MAKRMIIKAIKTDNGYNLQGVSPITKETEYPMEGYIHTTKKAAYEACESLYPHNSTWQGKKVSSGFSIVID